METIQLSDSAIQRIIELHTITKTQKAFRVYVTGGGCGGFQYGFGFEDTPQDDDFVMKSGTSDHPIQVLVDPISMMYLDGSVVEFKKELKGAYFTVTNPNAATTCSCGSSFSVDDD